MLREVAVAKFPDLSHVHSVTEIPHIIQAIFDISYDGILVIDKEEKIIELNQAYADFLKIRREDAIGRHVLTVIKNSKLPEFLKEWKTEMDVPHKLVEGQTPAQDKYVFVNRSSVMNPQGKIIASIAIIRFSYKTLELADRIRTLDIEKEYYRNRLREIADNQYSFHSIIGHSKKIRDIIRIAEKAAASEFPVLITGETGTGKEIFAGAIHYNSSRWDKPFIRINCAAIPSELLESELFGYEEGAFTGSKKGGKKGKFELANGGTIFLDEIGDMPLTMQAKILRVLQEQEIERVGGEKPKPISVRVIAATNKNLAQAIAQKMFRSDLFYRLNVVPVHLPALHERPEDIATLTEYFLKDLNEKYHSDFSITEEAKEVMTHYDWPGNFRELRNALERAYCMAEDSVITSAQLPSSLWLNSKIKESSANKDLKDIMEELEKEVLLGSLNRNHGNVVKASKELGIHKSTFYKKIQNWDLDKE